MDWVPSANTRRGPFSSSRDWRTRSAGPKPSSASDGYQMNASSSVIKTSAWPSPVRSTNFRFGSFHARLGRDLKVRKFSQLSVFRPFVEAGR